jgi:hypothetical protein
MPLPPLKNMLDHYDGVEEPYKKPSIDFTDLLTEGSEEYIEEQVCIKNSFENVIKIADAACNKFPWLEYSVTNNPSDKSVIIEHMESRYKVISLWISQNNYIINNDEYEEFSTVEGFAKRVGYILESSKLK